MEPIYRSDGEWVAVYEKGHVFNVDGEWLGFVRGRELYDTSGQYVGFLSDDRRLLILSTDANITAYDVSVLEAKDKSAD